MNKSRLAGKNILITGGAQGMGLRLERIMQPKEQMFA